MSSEFETKLHNLFSIAYQNGWDNGFEHAEGAAEKQRDRKDFQFCVDWSKKIIADTFMEILGEDEEFSGYELESKHASHKKTKNKLRAELRASLQNILGMKKEGVK